MNAASIVSVITVYGVVFLYLLALYVEKGERPFRRTRRGFRRLPAWEKTFLVLFVGAWIAFASVKEGTNGVNQVEGDTNTVTQIEGNTNGTGSVPGPLMMGFFGRPNPAPGATPSVTEEDIARMWRISSTTDVGRLAAPTANAVTNADWRDYGGMSDVRRIKPDGWRFPYGDKATDGLTVFQNGDFRPNVKTHFFPRPFDANLSLLPRLNWRLLSDGGESVFWHEHTSSNSLILAWNNALYNREVSCPTNFQAELFADGRFDYRYPNRTVHYAPVFPFDWDGDGFENSVDPDPYVANPIDAHGTNDEWLRVVCSNVFENVGGGVAFRGDVNTNAYYFVEVCAEKGAAPIYFNPDRTSRLGSPVIVANGGVTNHVPLLIGVGYVVTSTVPISVSFTDIGFTQVTQNDERSYAVKWPLDAVFTEGYSGSNRTYTISFTPYDPGGTFTWDEAPSPLPHPLLLGASGGPACGCVTCSGNTVTFGCTPNCTCHGDCQATGGYCYENAMFAITGGVCRCGFDDPDEPEIHSEDGGVPSFSISFSKRAVIFEDTYEHIPGQWKPRRSTRVRVSISAYGGSNGGNLTLTTSNLDKLVPVACGPMEFPTSMSIGPGRSYNASFICEGCSASGISNDVQIAGTFVERDTDDRIDSEASITVFRIKLQPVVMPYQDATYGRHVLGVCEFVEHFQFPVSPAVTWNPCGGGANVVDSKGRCLYQCPLFACENPLLVEVFDVGYMPEISVLAPNGMIAETVREVTYGLANGKAGGIGMELFLYATPRYVSFSQIKIQEVVCFTYESEGYFTNPYFNGVFAHTGGIGGAGAGTWLNVTDDNKVGDYDTAAYRDEIPWLTADGHVTTNSTCSWTDGTVSMDNPFGWGPLTAADDDPPYNRFAEDTRNAFMLTEDGTFGIRKLNRQVIRYTNGVIRLDTEYAR